MTPPLSSRRIGDQDDRADVSASLSADERLRRLDNYQRILERLPGQTSQRRKDALHFLLTRPSLGQFDQDDAQMWGRKLASVALKVVVLGDERCACRSRIGKHIGVRACAQPDIIGMLCRIPLVVQRIHESRRQILVHEEAPA